MADLDFNLDLLHEETTSETLLAESSTGVKAGTYRGRVTKAPGKEVEPGAKYGVEGRHYINMTIQLFEIDDVGHERKRGNVFAKASWEEHHGEKGYLDKQSKLWGQLVRAVNGARMPIREVIAILPEMDIGVTVQEAFEVQVQDIASERERNYQSSRGYGDYEEVTIYVGAKSEVKNADGETVPARDYYLGLGLESKANVASFFKLKD